MKLFHVHQRKREKWQSFHGQRIWGSQAQTLAERIATSTCRKSGQVGHWKKECPPLTSKGNSKGKTSAPDTITLAEALVAHPTGFEASKIHIDELPHTLPENAMDIGQQDSVKTGVGSIFLGESFESIPTNENFLVPKYFQKVPSKESQMFKNSVKALMQQHFQFTNR